METIKQVTRYTLADLLLIWIFSLRSAAMADTVAPPASDPYTSVDEIQFLLLSDAMPDYRSGLPDDLAEQAQQCAQ